MITKAGITLILLLTLSVPALHAQFISLKKGIRIQQSVSVTPGLYSLPGSTAEDPVIVVEGDNIIIDFSDVQIRGDADGQLPDTYSGLGILIQNSRNVTIRNLRVRGYKVGLMARNVQQLVLENCDLSYNYRKRLNSTALGEDLSDWMSYHQNEKDEWLRYGAAIYLRDCEGAEIKGCKVTGGQNALMMTSCNRSTVINNNFSFNSGIGIGLYRSSYNFLAHNKVNFNVRGYSHGVYNRGQDSAGFLVYEQSSNNIFYRNAATHSGDGFFLWAGQSTMDTGAGGCNDNLIVGNDFSYAPTNGIEVTFSRNLIAGNRIFECDHGIWGGYSYDTRITENQFRNNRIAIAIEHGQRNTIDLNLFFQDKEAIRLWARASRPAGWGYALYRDTRSRGYNIWKNSFNRIGTVLNLARTDSIWYSDNLLSQVETIWKTDSLVTNIDSMPNELDEPLYVIPEVENPQDAFQGGGRLAGRKNIRMTEWGPYDYQRPLIWHNNPADKGDTLVFEMLGPGKKWKIRKTKGLSYVSAKKGRFPAELRAVRKKTSGTADIQLHATAETDGGTDFDGSIIRKSRRFQFGFRYFFQPISWQVRWFAADTSRYNPITQPGLFPPDVRMMPVKTDSVDRLEYAWWGGIKADETYPQFLTLAEGEADVPAGEYDISVTWDDAVRLYVDDKLVLDEWNPSLYKFDESPNRRIPVKLGGKHRFRVEHVELGGFATLSVKLIAK